MIDLLAECGKVWNLWCCLHAELVDAIAHNTLWVVSEISKNSLITENQ